MATSTKLAAPTATGQATARAHRPAERLNGAALQLANLIFSQRERLGPRIWRRWAENELRKNRDLEAGARKELNRLLGIRDAS